MRRIAVVVPTRGRPALARRAVLSFLAALRVAAPDAAARIVVADDSDAADDRARLLGIAAEAAAAAPASTVEVLSAPVTSVKTVAEPGGGPGSARNRGLARLRTDPAGHDAVVMFDDDVCFTDIVYQGSDLRCDGAALLREALSLSERPRTVVGCGYVGRQDLSILEHIRLDAGSDPAGVAPSVVRDGVDNVAPAGISTAFLAIGSPARHLPDFPCHYNEDYVWLHALRRAGWRLDRVGLELAHAPTGSVSVTAPALSFQVFGEIVWLAVLEQARFPVASARSLAAAVAEIAGDLRDACASPGVRARPAVAAAVREVLGHYDGIAASIRCGGETAAGETLRAAIHRALALAPPD